MSSDENYHGPINPNPGNGEGESSLLNLNLDLGIAHSLFGQMTAAVSLYGFVPTNAFPVIALLTFGLSLLAHTTNFVRLRSTRVFEGLLVAGSVSFVPHNCSRPCFASCTCPRITC